MRALEDRLAEALIREGLLHDEDIPDNLGDLLHGQIDKNLSNIINCENTVPYTVFSAIATACTEFSFRDHVNAAIKKYDSEMLTVDERRLLAICFNTVTDEVCDEDFFKLSPEKRMRAVLVMLSKISDKRDLYIFYKLGAIPVELEEIYSTWDTEEMNKVITHFFSLERKYRYDETFPIVEYPILDRYIISAHRYLIDDAGGMLDMFFPDCQEKEKPTVEDHIKEFLKEHTPQDVIDYLSERVLNQTQAIETVVYFFWTHLLRVLHPDRIERQTLLLFGNSGCGKSSIFRALAEISPVPIMGCDATVVTPSSYAGTTLSDLVRNTSQRSGAGSEAGLFVLDEFDKLCQRDNRTGQLDEVSAESQSELLLFLGEDALITDTRGQSIDCSRNSIALLGAFQTVTADKVPDKCIGFTEANSHVGKENPDLMDAFLEHGIIPEVLGRISLFARIQDLTAEDYRAIIDSPHCSPLNSLQNLFEFTGCKLHLAEDGKKALISHMVKNKTGARGLRAILANASRHLFFEAAAGDVDELEITERDIQNAFR